MASTRRRKTPATIMIVPTRKRATGSDRAARKVIKYLSGVGRAVFLPKLDKIKSLFIVDYEEGGPFLVKCWQFVPHFRRAFSLAPRICDVVGLETGERQEESKITVIYGFVRYLDIL